MVAWVMCVVGFAIVGVIAFVEADVSDDNLSTVLLMVAFMGSPWLVFAAFCRRWESDIGVVAAGVLLLGFELFIYRDVFIDPKSSTAPLAYVVKPFIQVLLLLPLGLGLGWIGDRRATESDEGQ
jgi:hypothetical protein